MLSVFLMNKDVYIIRCWFRHDQHVHVRPNRSPTKGGPTSTGRELSDNSATFLTHCRIVAAFVMFLHQCRKMYVTVSAPHFT